jgi:hypothetical protein
MNLCKRLLCSAVLAALFGFGFGSAWAQDAVSGSISGTITDTTGAVVVGANVALTNVSQARLVREVVTNSSGMFVAPSLPLGVYDVKIGKAGFKTESITGLVLNANDALTVNKTLVAGSVSEVVTVQADVAQLNLENATSQGIIDGAQLNELVLNNRNYEQFLELQPGVVYGNASTDQLYVSSVAPAGTSAAVNFAVNGGRSTQNNWTVDGADNVDRGANLTLLTFPSTDAIGEIRVLRGQYSAAFGRSATGQIDVVTKSGTNQFHGSAYEFFRNDILNANTWANKLTAPAVITPRPLLRYNDFGESLGGPVWLPHLYNGKGKTFFFFSDETRRVVQYVSTSGAVPLTAEMNGDFSNAWYKSGTTWLQEPQAVCTAFNTATGACTASGDSIPTGSQSNAAKAIIKDIYAKMPQPNATANAAAGLDPHTVTANISNIFNNNQVLVRIDQGFGEKLNLFYRYVHDTFPTTQGQGVFTTMTIAGANTTIESNPGTQQMGHFTYILSPTSILTGGYAYSNNRILATPVGLVASANAPDVGSAITMPYSNLAGIIPTVAITNISTLQSGGIYLDYNNNHNVFANVTKSLGRHTFTAGASWDHYQKQETPESSTGTQGSFGFTNGTVPAPGTGLNAPYSTELAFSNFLLGDANNGFGQASAELIADIRANSFEAFAQDDFKVSKRLTLNLGVRYSFFGQPTDANGHLSNFDPATFSAAKAPAMLNTGLMCMTGTCNNNTNYIGTGVPASVTANSSADFVTVNNQPAYVNGMIFINNNVSGQSSPYGNKVGQAEKTDFAPRIGFAYDVFGDGKTSLRGGFGWAYDQSEVSFYESQVWTNPPAVFNYSLGTSLLDNPSLTPSAAATVSSTPQGFYASPLSYKTPYVEQYSLGIQRAISPTFMAEVAYVGTHGVNLLGVSDINQPKPNAYAGIVSPLNASTAYATVDGFTACTYNATTCPYPIFWNSTADRAINYIRPYPGYGHIGLVQPIYSSNYNSLQVKVTKHFQNKSMVDFNYTFERNLTNTQNDYSTDVENIYNVAGDYGRAADDRNQVAAIDYVLAEPWFKEQRGIVGKIVGGWETSGIIALDAGLPLTPTMTGSVAPTPYGYTSAYNNLTQGPIPNDSSGIGAWYTSGSPGNSYPSLRPNQIGDPRKGNGQSIHNASQWYYKGAFASPYPAGLNPGGVGTVGTEKRGVVSGPGFERWDVGLFRNFKLPGKLNLQLRGEAFNALNHTNLGNPCSNTISSSCFAQITSARDNRIMQVAGKITF